MGNRGSRRCRSRRPGRDALRDDGTVRAPWTNAAVRRPRSSRTGWPASSRDASTRTRRAAAVRAAAHGRNRDGPARPPCRAASERGLADLGGAEAPARDLKLAVSVDGRAVVPGRRWVTGRSRDAGFTSCGHRSTRSASGWARCGSTRRGSTRATSRVSASHADSRSAAGRCRRARISSSVPARSPTSWHRSPPTASSRCSSRAGRRSPPRSSQRASSTGCSCSSPPCSRAAGADARRAGAADRSRRARGGARRRGRPAVVAPARAVGNACVESTQARPR